MANGLACGYSRAISFAISSNSLILNKLSTIGLYNFPLNYFDTYVDKINAVTLKQVKESFKRHIDLNHMVIITVGESLDRKL
jgi:zinc protease